MNSGLRQYKVNGRVNLLLLTLILLLSNFKSRSQESDPTYIKVGVYDNPPKIFINEAGQPDGLFIDVLKGLSDDRIKIEFVEGEWTELTRKLRRNEIHILPDVAYSESRDSLFIINSVPVISSWLEAFALEESKVSSVKDFRNKKLGVLEGSVQELFFHKLALQEKDIPFELVTYPNYSRSVEALAERQIDLLIASRFFNFSEAKKKYNIKSTGLVFRPSSLHFAFSDNIDQSIVEHLDSKLSQQKNDPESPYYRSLNTSLSIAPSPIPSYLYWILGVIFLLLLFTLGFLILLRYQVKLKTRALWKRNRQLTKAKEKAEESERLKTIFLQNMSHEIRTPMNGILGFMQLLKNPDLDSRDREKYIDVVTKSGKRLLTTINNIIEISKINSDQIKVHTRAVYLPEVMDFYYSFFEPQAQEKRIELRLTSQLSPKEGSIITDKFILDNILTNLINNAIKFTHKGYVEFGNYREGNELVFFVHDTGVGIPKDRQEAVFGRFVQANLNDTRPHEGSGLGLAIVSAYVRSLGGRIWLKSKVNQGTSFYFSIPFVPANHDLHKNDPEEELQSLAGLNLKILIAEDDAISYLFLAKILDFPGIALVRAKTGKECVEYVRNHPEIDLVLMDVKMPILDGIDATREIRTFNKKVPILIQTAYSSSEDQEKAIASGANGYVTKPVEPQLLFELIRKYT